MTNEKFPEAKPLPESELQRLREQDIRQVERQKADIKERREREAEAKRVKVIQREKEQKEQKKYQKELARLESLERKKVRKQLKKARFEEFEETIKAPARETARIGRRAERGGRQVLRGAVGKRIKKGRKAPRLTEDKKLKIIKAQQKLIKELMALKKTTDVRKGKVTPKERKEAFTL